MSIDLGYDHGRLSQFEELYAWRSI